MQQWDHDTSCVKASFKFIQYSNSVTHGTKVGSAVVGLYDGSVVGVNVGNKVGSDVGIN